MAQLKLSKGLRKTRTTARQRTVCDGGTSAVPMPESLWKTHLASGRSTTSSARYAQYSAIRNRLQAAKLRSSKPLKLRSKRTAAKILLPFCPV